MSRRQYLENIIIGTLMESDAERNYFDDCKVLLPDMFKDETNRRIYEIVAEMNGRGMTDTSPFNIFKEYGNAVLDMVPRMGDLLIDYSFIHLKTSYNEKRFIAGMRDGKDYGYTNVEFADYVTQFLKLVYEN